MPSKLNYEDHNWVLENWRKRKESEHDMREYAREAAGFLTSRQGMWEQHWWNASKGKPRYTFDLTSPILDQIEGSLNAQDFTIKVHPAGGPASKEVAKTYDGIVRHIEDISSADQVYEQASGNTAVCGIDGWEVVQEYVQGDSFDQDLMIKTVPDWLDSVWLGPHTRRDGSDARYGWKLTGMTKEEFQENFKNASTSGSLDSDRSSSTHTRKDDLIFVGAFYYLVPEIRKICRYSNGNVYAVDDLTPGMIAQLEELGYTKTDEREATVLRMHIRQFDNNGWLEEPRATIFENWLTLIPNYANFRYVEQKLIYYGAIEKLMDPQRVYNYAKSREIEEGALAPRKKWVATPKQIAGFEKEWDTLNVDPSAYIRYNHVDGVPPPSQSGSVEINPGLQSLSADMRDMMSISAGMFSASMGQDLAVQQSGVAIEKLQDRGDQGNNKYINAREWAQRQTGRILVNAIPKVYPPGRQVRLLEEDGSFDIVTIGDVERDRRTGQPVIDPQTNQPKVVHDLSQGQYDVTCKSGPTYKSRQSETVANVLELAEKDPTIIQGNKDILLQNIGAPGTEQIAERERFQLLMAGRIPQDQMTDEELAMQEQIQAMQAQQPDPMMVAAMAEDKKASAEQLEAQTKLVSAQTEQYNAQVNGQTKMLDSETNRMNAETARIKVEIEARSAGVDAEATLAKARKDTAAAVAQEVENTATVQGVVDILDQIERGVMLPVGVDQDANAQPTQ